MKNEDKYSGYKVIKLDPEITNEYSSWDIIGIRDENICPECQYLGRTCDICGGEK